MADSNETSGKLDELASLIVDYLPGPAPGYAITSASFQGIASELELSQYWQGRQIKAQSVKSLLLGTLQNDPQKFAGLMFNIVERSKHLRGSKNALTQSDLDSILNCLRELGQTVPELSNKEYREKLPSGTFVAKATQALRVSPVDLFSRMRKELVSITMMPEDEQAYALELFLNKLFSNCNLPPLHPFRRQENEIAGRVRSGKHDYNVHAYWHFSFSKSDLERALGQLSGESTCVCLSLRGFKQELKDLFDSGFDPRFLAVDLRDLFFVLDGGANLEQMLALKLNAARKGRSFVLTQDLLSCS